MNPHALVVQNSTSGTPNSSAASTVKLITPSETMQVTGGASELLTLARRFLKWGRQVLLVDSQREGISWVTSTSYSGRPSGMVSKRNEGRPLREEAPLDLRRRLWLYSVLTKVMWKPLKWRSFASFSIGFMWPCAGYGMHTAWGLFAVPKEPIFVFSSLDCTLWYEKEYASCGLTRPWNVSFYSGTMAVVVFKLMWISPRYDFNFNTTTIWRNLRSCLRAYLLDVWT